MDALDDDRARQLALGGTVGGGSEVDDQGAGGHGGRELAGLHPVQPGPRPLEPGIDPRADDRAHRPLGWRARAVALASTSAGTSSTSSWKLGVPSGS